MSAADDPVLPFASREEWEAWLSENHESADGVWLKLARKGSGIESVTKAEALEVALCHGWIDGQGKSLDEHWWLQRFTPRRARSRWSKINRDAATRLIESGQMKPAGLREVERAQADGRWDAAYDSPSSATVPDDFQAALDAEPQLRERFEQLDGRNRYSILHRIQDAKRPETRARRIAKFVEMLRDGRTLY